jgi:hypothetical protein
MRRGNRTTSLRSASGEPIGELPVGLGRRNSVLAHAAGGS